MIAPAPRAWAIVGASAAANTLAWSVRSTFALFYVALLDEFGWPRGQAALGYSLSWLFILAFGPLAGRLHDRLGARVAVPLGGLVLGAALALTGRVESLLQYCAVFGVLGAAGIALIMMPAAAAVSRWLPGARGTGMGLISAGSSLSAFVFYPLNAWLIAALGWRQAFTAYGAIVAVGVVAVALLGYPAGPGREGPGAPPDAAAPGEWTLAGALRSGRFWAVFSMWGLGVIGYQVMQTHQVAHARGQGIDPATVAFVLGLGGLFTAAGNVVGGALSERWGREAVFALGSAIGIAGIAAFATLDGPADVGTLLAYSAAGFGFGMRIALLTAIPADLFHGRHFGAILGLANGGGGLGGLIGPFLGGWLFDVTRDYRAAFAVAALAIAGSAVAAWLAAPRHARAAARR